MTTNQNDINDNIQAQQIIKQVVGSWTAQSKAITDFFNLYADQHYLNELAPGKNRGIYVLGHLISTNDGMLPLLGFGERLFPELEQLFSSNPDRSFDQLPSVNDLKEKWTTIDSVLQGHFSKLLPEDWLDRHTKVLPEDFVSQPERNKLSILLGRTNHISYHYGQLIFLKLK